MNPPDPTFAIEVDVSNPGQFFACCGLFEFAHRLWPGAEAWFEPGRFLVRCPAAPERALEALVDACSNAELIQLDPEDNAASPIVVGPPFDLRLDWWRDEMAGGKQLKVWAGSMRNVRIARAMQHAMRAIEPANLPRMFAHGTVVRDPDQPVNKVEPFYFDARRGRNARSLDIGFTPDALEMTSTAFPAVEFLCLVGLQRFRPAPMQQPRCFEYSTWTVPLPIPSAVPVVAGSIDGFNDRCFRFETAFRTGQKKHKCFMPAAPTRGGQ